jgi:osmotically-inducible protein OsmY
MQLCPHEISRLVEVRLRETSHPPLVAVTCDFDDGTATLRGDVPSFYLKQLAQSIARQTNGVTHVVNQIRVHTTERTR